MVEINNYKVKPKVYLWATITAVLVIFVFLAKRIGNNPPVAVEDDVLRKNFGWSAEQFINWAYKVQPVKEHKRWKIWEDGRKELMEPDAPFLVAILNDINDVSWGYPKYQYEWGFELPDELPDPVVKVIESISFADVNDILGKDIDEIIACLEKPIIEICAKEEGHLTVSSEAISVRLSNLANDKRRFNLETEPFILSDNPDIHGKIAGRVVLYVPRNSEINIQRAQGKRDEL